MASLDEIITEIQASKKAYEDAQQVLVAAAKGAEEGAQAMAAMGVEDKAEMLENLKADLDKVSEATTSIADALDTAVSNAEAIKG
ncbi:hypothetical protein [Kineosporia babensis]|uniref:Uncharacterized protein n=1 Tax=Kineosporia babensis TaxID=499548 RepID=A0A9X1NNY1_9ACTN|nr:hypothetical protein [Kineosporia babensis]MCD5316611.1 hypothetical protein [Kineosporia babensis]